MSIKIPGGAPPTGVPADSQVERSTSGAPAPGGAFVDKLHAPAADGAGAARGADAVAAVTAELKAGRLSPQQAVDKVLELVVDKGAAAHLPEAVKAKIRVELEALLADDPLLGQKTRRLGVAGDGEA